MSEMLINRLHLRRFIVDKAREALGVNFHYPQIYEDLSILFSFRSSNLAIRPIEDAQDHCMFRVR